MNAVTVTAKIMFNLWILSDLEYRAGRPVLSASSCHGRLIVTNRSLVPSLGLITITPYDEQPWRQ